MSEANDTHDVEGDWESEDEDFDDDKAEGDETNADTSGREHDAEAAENGPGRDAQGRGRRRRPKLEPTDEHTKQALNFLTELLSKMQMDCEVHLNRPKEEGSTDIQLEVSGRDAGRVIGKKGQVLSAVQFLCNRIINRPGQERRYVTVDAEGYRSRREDSLATMARRLGKQAIMDGKIITFEPMNPRDRRVVHLALAKFEGVVTRSEGEGDSRRVQIIPVRRQPVSD